MRQAVVRCVIVGVGFLLLASSGAKGLDRETTRATLRGLDGVEVVVENMDTDVERAGVTRNQLQTDVELRLRKAGIRVFTQQERLSMPGQPWLYVRVATLKIPGLELYAFSVDVELTQSMYLARDPHVAIDAPTWSPSGVIGTLRPSNLRQLREEVADLVDRFINTYLAVNPEKAGRTRPRQSSQPSVEGATIRQVQERLADRGFNTGPLDGQMGEKTQVALRQFQRAHGLPPTGALDDATRTALGLE